MGSHAAFGNVPHDPLGLTTSCNEPPSVQRRSAGSHPVTCQVGMNAQIISPYPKANTARSHPRPGYRGHP